MDAVHEQEIAALQRTVADKHARAVAAAPGTAQRKEAVEAVIAAARRLLAYEDQLPALLDEPARVLSVQVVRGSGIVAMAGAIATAAAVFRGPLGWGWYVPAAAAGIQAAVLLLVAVHPAGGKHVVQRRVSIVGAALAAAMAPAGIWIGWWTGVVLTLGVFGVNVALDKDSEARTEGSSE